MLIGCWKRRLSGVCGIKIEDLQICNANMQTSNFTGKWIELLQEKKYLFDCREVKRREIQVIKPIT